MNLGKAARGPWIYFVATMLAYACVILAATDPPPFVDLPDWVYQGVLFHGALTGHPVAGYALKHYPVPNSLTTVGLGLLDLLMPWQWAGKVWVVLYLALATLASWTVLRASKVDAWPVVVTMPVLFLNLDFWWGHISFEMGLCLVLLLVAMLLQDAPAWSVSAMLVLLFFTHMEDCAGGLLVLIMWLVLLREWRKLWTAVPVAGLIAWYSIARFVGGDADVRGLPGAGYRYGSVGFVVYKVNTFVKVFGFVNVVDRGMASISERLEGRVAFLVLVAASLAMAAIFLIKIVRAALAKQTQHSTRVIALSTLTLLAISALLPQIWLGVADPGSRLVLMAAATGLLIVDWRGRCAVAIAMLSVVFCCVNLYQLQRVERDPRIAGKAADLPSSLLRYGQVEPATRLDYYEKLRRGEMDEAIFPTAMFVKKGQ